MGATIPHSKEAVNRQLHAAVELLAGLLATSTWTLLADAHDRLRDDDAGTVLDGLERLHPVLAGADLTRVYVADNADGTAGPLHLLTGNCPRAIGAGSSGVTMEVPLRELREGTVAQTLCGCVSSNWDEATFRSAGNVTETLTRNVAFARLVVAHLLDAGAADGHVDLGRLLPAALPLGTLSELDDDEMFGPAHHWVVESPWSPFVVACRQLDAAFTRWCVAHRVELVDAYQLRDNDSGEGRWADGPTVLALTMTPDELMMRAHPMAYIGWDAVVAVPAGLAAHDSSFARAVSEPLPAHVNVADLVAVVARLSEPPPGSPRRVDEQLGAVRDAVAPALATFVR